MPSFTWREEPPREFIGTALLRILALLGPGLLLILAALYRLRRYSPV